MCEAHGANLVLHDLRTGRAQTHTSDRDPAESAKYMQYYASINPWMPAEGQTGLSKTVIPGEAALPTSQLRRTEFYADWGRKNDVVFTWAANMELRDERFLFLSVDRGESRGPFPDHVSEVLSLVAPHLQRALHLGERLSQASALARTLDQASIPALTVSDDGRVLSMTEGAHQLLLRGDALRLDGVKQRLRATSPASHAQLLALLQRLKAQPLPRTGIVRLQRQDHRRDLVLVITRTRVLRTGFSSDGFEITFLTPDVSFDRALTAAGRSYRLTAAEIHLVRALLAAGSLEQAVLEIGISRNTGKSQLSSVFAKTGTHRQAEVIRLFSFYARFTHLGDD